MSCVFFNLADSVQRRIITCENHPGIKAIEEKCNKTILFLLNLELWPHKYRNLTLNIDRAPQKNNIPTKHVKENNNLFVVFLH